MEYTLEGAFIESCDCASICPCWLDQAPDEGHCTGLFAWRLGARSAIDGLSMADRVVVSVSEHLGERRQTPLSSTVLFIDEGATAAQFTLLSKAFSGALDGPLADLAALSGTVLAAVQADITYVDDANGDWSVQVRYGNRGKEAVVSARGKEQIFTGDSKHPLMLEHTALDKELQILGALTALSTQSLGIRVATLPVGYLTVTNTSGMKGTFAYHHADAGD